MFVAAAAALYHPPYVVISPGESFDIVGNITISGAPVTPVNGAYLLTSVRLSQPDALGLLAVALNPEREVVDLESVVPSGVDLARNARTQHEVFKQSELLAAVAAARATRHTAAGWRWWASTTSSRRGHALSRRLTPST